jgi:ornithine cyclodeaminase/alanine dehydrogenase-like protein (mu-crystallin family)
MSLLLSEADVLSVLSMKMALEAVEESMRLQARGEATNHPRRRHRVSGGFLHEMDAALDPLAVMGLKVYTTSQGDQNRFHVLLYSADSGKLLALIEADALGRYRTGAATAVAARYLGCRSPREAVVVGAGRQARTQVLALILGLDIRRFRIYSRDGHKVLEMLESIHRELRDDPVQLTCEHLDWQKGISTEGADLVVTITTARAPVLAGRHLNPGLTVVAAGANSMQRRELDRDCFKKFNRVVVDSIEQARIESLAISDAAAAGLLPWESVIELKDVVSGKIRGRGQDGDVVLFESHGIALWDIALANRVYDEARLRGLGVEIPTE